MVSPCHSKVRSAQNTGVPLFSCSCYGAFGKGKVSSKNSNLSDLVDINVSMKMVNKLCVSDGIYTLLKKSSYYFLRLY